MTAQPKRTGRPPVDDTEVMRLAKGYLAEGRARSRYDAIWLALPVPSASAVRRIERKWNQQSAADAA